MKTLNDILYQKNILDMFPKIQAYYQKHLNIHVESLVQTLHGDSEDDPLETLLTFPHVNQKTGDNLDSGELISIFSTYLLDVFKHNSPSLEQLVEIKNHIEYLKDQQLTYNFIDDYPQAAVIKRFVDGCYYSVEQQLKKIIYERLSHINYQNIVIDPLESYLVELQTILPHCDLSNLIDFKEVLENLTNKATIPEAELEGLQTKLTKISSTIDTEINKRMKTLLSMLEMSNEHMKELEISSKERVINEMLPTLKNQIYIKKNLPILGLDEAADFHKLLEHSIKNNILKLLNLCQQEVQYSISDINKQEKIQVIEDLKGQCVEEKDPNLLYQEIIKHGDLLKSKPIGRYLYECICWFLGIKIHKDSYYGTLFQAVSTKLLDVAVTRNTNRREAPKKHQM